MEGANETTSATVWPPIGRSRPSLTCAGQLSYASPSETNNSVERLQQVGRTSSYVVDDDDAEASVDEHGDDVNDADAADDDDSEEMRALASAAAGLDETDESSDEAAAGCDGGEAPADEEAASDGLSSPAGADHLHAGPPLSSSSASVLGRIAAGLSTAVSGGLHPLKRSTRVAPDMTPTPRLPEEPKEFFWGPVMPGYPTSPPDSDELKSVPSTMVIRQTVQLEQTSQTSNNNADGDIGLRQAIPVMPIYLAVACCLMNVISPGLGKMSLYILAQ